MSRSLPKPSTSSTRSKSARNKPRRRTSKRGAAGIVKSSLGAPRDSTEAPEEPFVIEWSSGNVFLDLGFPPAEAEYLLLRSKLMLMLTRVIRDRKLTQAKAAAL